MTSYTLGQAAGLVLAKLNTPARSGGTLRAPHRARHHAPHRTGAPVLRDSMEAGTFEDAFFAAPAKGETDRLLRLARAALDRGRKVRRAARAEGRCLTGAESLLAQLTASAVRIYEELLTLARLNRGRVFPSYDRLAEVTGLGRATVARALAVLEQVGFLVRQRRFARVEGEGAGPRYAQTSNAYRPTLPRRIMGLLPRWLQPAPPPDDQLQREADRVEATVAMLAGLSCREMAGATVGGALGRMLARLGAALDARERESHHDPEPLLESVNRSVESVGLGGRQRSA